MKSNHCVPCSKTTIYMNELLLPSITLFDIKCKKLNPKNLWKCIFRTSKRERERESERESKREWEREREFFSIFMHFCHSFIFAADKYLLTHRRNYLAKQPNMIFRPCVSYIIMIINGQLSENWQQRPIFKNANKLHH